MKLLITVRHAMKRSEAVKKLAIILKASKGYDTKTRASQIINYLECDEIGMEPPIRDRWIEGHECEENSWEPEND